jgi:hypothetical protein
MGELRRLNPIHYASDLRRDLRENLLTRPTTQPLPPIVSLLSLTPIPQFWWLLVGTIVDDSIVMSNSPQLFGR